MSNLTKVVGIRVTEDLYTKLATISHTRGEDVSDFVRRSILKELAQLSFLSATEKKALGIT
jgi:negative regulator of replication initiation